MTDLSGKSALVTGEARGIGAAIVRRLAADGARVAFTYASSTEIADALAQEVGGSAIQADAADPDAAAASVARAVTDLGGLDILVHNAGIASFASVAPGSFGEFRRQFGVNVDGVYAATAAAVPHLSDGGRIIIIGSINAHAMPIAGGAIYGASKAAVAGLARGWARDLGPRGILVNVVQPGPIDTDLNPADGPFAETLTKLTALGRYGKAEEVAALTAFLASGEASYITGALIDIDGGLTI